MAVVLVTAAPCWSRAAEPVRLTVEPARLEVPVGESVEVTVGLADGRRQPATAPRDLAVVVSVRRSDENETTRRLKIAAGETAAQVRIEAESPGVVEIQATHPELRSGGAFVRMVEGEGPEPEAVPTAGARPLHLMIPTERRVAETVEMPESSALAFEPPTTVPRPAEPSAAAGGQGADRAAAEAEMEVMDPAAEGEAAEGETVAEEGAAPSAEAAPGAMPEMAAVGEPALSGAVELPELGAPAGGGPGSPARLVLRPTPQRDLLANGEDASEIYAWLEGGETTGYRIRLVSDTGRLDPPLVEIPAGRRTGTTRLTASTPGVVKVEYLGAEPQLGGVDPQVVEVEFDPAITAMELEVDAELPVGTRREVVVRLVDEQGHALATDEDREVEITPTRGPITVEPGTLTIPAGGFSATATVSGDWWGEGEVQAASPNLLTRTAPVNVRFPWALLVVSAVGSLAGGFIAWSRGRGKRRWLVQRLFTGLVAGLVLYWLLLVTGVTTAVPAGALGNPLGVFAVSVLGGWLGTEVFDLALDRLGLRRAEEPADPE